MQIYETVAAAVVTISIAGLSYAAFNSDSLTRRADAVATAADCRTVDAAIVAYLAEHGSAPTRVEQLKPYIRGGVSTYRIVQGRAAGPGCPA